MEEDKRGTKWTKAAIQALLKSYERILKEEKEKESNEIIKNERHL